MAAHSSILAWEIPWTEGPGGYSPWVCESVGRDLATKQKRHTPLTVITSCLIYSPCCSLSCTPWLLPLPYPCIVPPSLTVTTHLFSVSLSLLFFVILTAAAAKSLQLCPTLCDPIDDSPPGSPVPGILQARPLEWAAISFSNAQK